MTQITEENRAMCVRDCGRKALIYLDQMWICGQCYHEYSQRQLKQRQKMFLEG